MSPGAKMRAYLNEPGYVVMPAVWDGLSAKLAAQIVLDGLRGAVVQSARNLVQIDADRAQLGDEALLLAVPGLE